MPLKFGDAKNLLCCVVKGVPFRFICVFGEAEDALLEKQKGKLKKKEEGFRKFGGEGKGLFLGVAIGVRKQGFGILQR